MQAHWEGASSLPQEQVSSPSGTGSAAPGGCAGCAVGCRCWADRAEFHPPGAPGLQGGVGLKTNLTTQGRARLGSAAVGSRALHLAEGQREWVLAAGQGSCWCKGLEAVGESSRAGLVMAAGGPRGLAAPHPVGRAVRVSSDGPRAPRRRAWLTASLPSRSSGCGCCASCETTSQPPTAQPSTAWSCC